MLSKDTFKKIVKYTPLISIDLIIEDKKGKILLGRRSNFPAKGKWFVPGGRIRKDEKFRDAFHRILKSETGLNQSMEDTHFVGVYEHLYPGENFAGDPEFSTHYIVIAYRLKLNAGLSELPKEQHSDYWWVGVPELIEHPDVHHNTKNYFNGYPSFCTQNTAGR